MKRHQLYRSIRQAQYKKATLKLSICSALIWTLGQTFLLAKRITSRIQEVKKQRRLSPIAITFVRRVGSSSNRT
jgi:hypothetical protein